MMDNPALAVGVAVVRLLAVLAIVAGVLLGFVGLTQGNISRLILGVILVAGPGYLLSRSRRRDQAARDR